MKKSGLYGLWMAALIALLLVGMAIMIAGLIKGKPQPGALMACIPFLSLPG